MYLPIVGYLFIDRSNRQTLSAIKFTVRQLENQVRTAFLLKGKLHCGRIEYSFSNYSSPYFQWFYLNFTV